MEKVNDRRKFVKGLGLFSAFVAGYTAPMLANTGTSTAVRTTNDSVVPLPVDPSLAPPEGAFTLQINGAYGEPPKPSPTNGLYGFQPIGAVTNTVVMTVGKDDRLWIKVNDEWRRLALEG